MSDTISRAGAIDALERIFDRCEEIEAHLPEGDPDRVGYKMYPDWLKVWNYLHQLPSAQPNLQPTCNQLATDCISRQEALNIRFSDAINEDGVLYVPLRDFTDGLKALPSAQTEIIRCKDCKHVQRWRSEESAKKFGQAYECARNVINCPKPDDFCSYAERKSNG